MRQGELCQGCGEGRCVWESLSYLPQGKEEQISPSLFLDMMPGDCCCHLDTVKTVRLRTRPPKRAALREGDRVRYCSVYNHGPSALLFRVFCICRWNVLTLTIIASWNGLVRMWGGVNVLYVLVLAWEKFAWTAGPRNSGSFVRDGLACDIRKQGEQSLKSEMSGELQRPAQGTIPSPRVLLS